MAGNTARAMICLLTFGIVTPYAFAMARHCSRSRQHVCRRGGIAPTALAPGGTAQVAREIVIAVLEQAAGSLCGSTPATSAECGFGDHPTTAQLRRWGRIPAERFSDLPFSARTLLRTQRAGAPASELLAVNDLFEMDPGVGQERCQRQQQTAARRGTTLQLKAIALRSPDLRDCL